MEPDRRKLPPLSALIPVTLGLAAAIAVFSLFRATLVPPRLTPALTIDTIPGASWHMDWSARALTPGALQLEGLAQLLGVLGALGLIVLGGALINTAIALLSNATARRYEIALRAMVGASPRMLTREFVADGLLLGCFGAVFGTFIGLAAAAALHRAWPAPVQGKGIPLIQPILLLAALCLPLAASFLFSLAPRLRMTRAGWIGDALSPEARSNPGIGASDMRNALVVVQFALALVLFTSAGVLLRTARTMQLTASTPYQLEGLMSAETDGAHLGDAARANAYQNVLTSLSNTPGVQAESISSRGTVLGIGMMDRVSVACGRCSFGGMYAPVLPITVKQYAIARDYFRTLGVRLESGRDLAPGRDEVIINKTLVSRGFQDDGPVLGKQIQIGGFRGRWYTVVGIVADMPDIGLHSESELPTGLAAGGAHGPALYLPALAHPPAAADLVFRTSAGAHTAERDVAAAIRKTGLRVTSIAPARTRIEHAMQPLVWFARAFAFISVIVLFLALQGLYALMRTNVEARRTEIGLRRAVGARRVTVMLMILREAAVLVAIGSVIGALVAPTIAQLIKVYFPSVHIFDPMLTIGAIVALSIASLLGALAPARQAAWQDPALALQHE